MAQHIHTPLQTEWVQGLVSGLTRIVLRLLMGVYILRLGPYIAEIIVEASGECIINFISESGVCLSRTSQSKPILKTLNS